MHDAEVDAVLQASPQADAAETQDDAHPAKRRLTRRRFIAVSAATGVAAGAVTLPAAIAQDATPGPRDDGSGMPEVVDPLTEDAATAVPEQTPAGAQLQGCTFFTPPQAAIVAAAADRLIPSDEHGPGATEAGVVYFIDRQLTDQDHFRTFRGPRYGLGPFIPGEPTQGDQSALDMQYRWRLGIEGTEAYAQRVFGRGFAALTPEQQERLLSDLEQGIPEDFPPVAGILGADEVFSQTASEALGGAEGWFQLLHSYTLAGFFADPVHGGNRDMVGWKLIGFPGAQGFVYDDWILRYGEEFTGGYKSLADYQAQFTGGR